MASEVTIAREATPSSVQNIISRRTRRWGGYSAKESVNRRTRALLEMYAYGAVPGRSSENRRRIIRASENMIRQLQNIK